MHRSTLLALTGISPTSATPCPSSPPTVSSLAFNLIANLTSSAKDYTPSVQNTIITSIHVGAGLNYVGLSEYGSQAADYGRIFYANGTAEELASGQSTVISDGGTPPFPMGWGIYTPTEGLEEGVHWVTLNAGNGTAGVALERDAAGAVVMGAPEVGTYIACNQTLQYYGPKLYFLVVKWAEGSSDSCGAVEYNVPESCVPINLLPQKAELNELPDPAYSSHEYAQEVMVYENVSAITWG